MRETNYGRLFDVRIEPSPGNLAFTSRAIRPHTDNPYRDPVPTVQLLHCLRTADDGGDTGLVDGFAAAADLRATDHAAFDVLARNSVPFGYLDQTAELRASQPLIQLSPRGRIRGVRFNNRSAQPLRLPYADVIAFYAAYRRWAGLLAEPERQLNLRLAPGDCLIFDNTRILHARTAFSVTGEPAPAGLLRRPGRPGQHGGRPAQRGDPMTAVEAIGQLFAGPGARDYLGEPVTIGTHMLQAGALAEAAMKGAGEVGGPPWWPPPCCTTSATCGNETDSRHGEAGAAWLGQWFGAAVTEPVRLHVAAKRYLCAVEPGYFGLLSEESVRTLARQGGPMTPGEAAAFEALPHARDAVAVRRWDDAAKDPAVTPPAFAHFAPLLEALIGS